MDAVAAARESGRPQPWSPAMSLEEMDKNEIATAIVSLVQPGVTIGTVEQARALARDCNEYGAKMVQDHPGRFGFFASIPLTDTEGSLKEAAYALDTLKADGINLFTSFGDKYLGDKSFEPVYEELNRRNAIVYTHPTQPKCCNNMKEKYAALGKGANPFIDPDGYFNSIDNYERMFNYKLEQQTKK